MLPYMICVTIIVVIHSIKITTQTRESQSINQSVSQSVSLPDRQTDRTRMLVVDGGSVRGEEGGKVILMINICIMSAPAG